MAKCLNCKQNTGSHLKYCDHCLISVPIDEMCKQISERYKSNVIKHGGDKIKKELHKMKFKYDNQVTLKELVENLKSVGSKEITRIMPLKGSFGDGKQGGVIIEWA